MTIFNISDYRDFLPRFYRLAGVSILSNMMVPLAGLCDSAFLGHLDNIHYLAGVVLGSILFDYLYRVLKFLRSGTNAITAQAVGSNDEEGVVLAILRSGFIALIIALIILIFQYPLERIGFTLLSGSPLIEQAGIDYFYARVWGAPAVLLNFVFIGWFLGMEKKSYILILSLVGNGSNVILDYLMIFRWGWGSSGAGLATAISQYLALSVALLAMIITIKWDTFFKVLNQVLDKDALKDVITLKGNLLIRFLTLISVYAIFTNLSAGLGTYVLAANGVLLQIALLSQFTVQGVGMTTQTMIGNCKGKGDNEKMMPILAVSIFTSVGISMSIAFLFMLFPHSLFTLLTNHGEITNAMREYTLWLFPLLTITATAFMLEGYFIGLKEGKILRNGVLKAFGLGFMPLVLLAWYWQNNNLLWAALTFYMTTLMVILLLELPKVHKSYTIQSPKFKESI